MSEMTNLILQVRYPYTAAVIAIVWLGSAILLAIAPSHLPVEQVVIFNSLSTIVLAAMGFTTPRR